MGEVEAPNWDQNGTNLHCTVPPGCERRQSSAFILFSVSKNCAKQQRHSWGNARNTVSRRDRHSWCSAPQKSRDEQEGGGGMHALPWGGPLRTDIWMRIDGWMCTDQTRSWQIDLASPVWCMLLRDNTVLWSRASCQSWGRAERKWEDKQRCGCTVMRRSRGVTVRRWRASEDVKGWSDGDASRRSPVKLEIRNEPLRASLEQLWSL